MQRIAQAGAGAVVTKSVGVEPRAGYPNPTVVQASAGLINAMGLPNPGIDEYAEEIKYAKTILKVPLIVSIYGYTAEEFATAAQKALKAGADALTVINTVKAMASDVETQMPVLGNVKGGLSGPAIKPIALRCVYEVFEAVKVPIFGCGGGNSWQDAGEFLLAGASGGQGGTGGARAET